MLILIQIKDNQNYIYINLYVDLVCSLDFKLPDYQEIIYQHNI
jgi:hypothetical protein